ncbi:hypothetical protein COY17_04275, partial [Candidatus Saccharibacteria bacterium CG_4_10_14_0_2_um_filter_52_9]
IGTATPGRALEVKATAVPVALFNRSNDGSVVEFASGGTVQGDISIAGATTSYNAFTGSHYGYTDQTLSAGELVTQVGSRQPANTEIEYQAARSTVANDPAILGSYLDRRSNGPADGILISAAGNGDAWVVDTGSNMIEGQYLISSDVAGHAMADPGTYAESHIIGRLQQPIDWSQVTTTVLVGGQPRKHAKVSIYYTFFDKAPANGQGLQGTDQSFANLTVTGTASFAALNVSGTATINNLTVTGVATVGTLTVTGSAQFSGDITIGGHVVTAGTAPTVQVEAAAGANATCTVTGNDTGGKLTIVTGTGVDMADGMQCTITFNKAFGAAPNPVISARNKDSTKVGVWVDADTTTMTIHFASAPLASTTYNFNYFIAQ